MDAETLKTIGAAVGIAIAAIGGLIQIARFLRELHRVKVSADAWVPPVQPDGIFQASLVNQGRKMHLTGINLMFGEGRNARFGIQVVAEDLPLELGQDRNLQQTFAQLAELIQARAEGYDHQSALRVMREATWAVFVDGNGDQHNAKLGWLATRRLRQWIDARIRQ
jgi:hypothetical protein